MATAPNARSIRSVIVFVAFLAIVMAFGVEAMLPAFDSIDVQFGFTDRGLSISLLVTALLVGMAFGMLLWGPVSDRFGRRPALVAGLVLYGIGAIGSAFAPNIELLLVARALWGFGAAAPGSLRFAIARDLYDGDRLARVVTIATAVFLIGPLVMPMIGELILTVGTWETITIVGAFLAVVAALWSVQFGETLGTPRPLRLGPVGEALRIIVGTPQTLGAIAASMFFFASFFVWLGSAQPIIDRIFGLDDQFVWFFAASGLAMSATLVVTDRWIGRVGMRNVAVRAAVAFVVVSGVGLLATLVAGGLSLWPWFGWVLVINGLSAVMGPVCSALALDPVGEIAGVTSSVLGFATLGPGAALAAIVDARIGDTVTPMIVGSTVFGILGLLSLWLSQPISSGISDFRRPMKSSSSSSTAESIGGAS